MKHPRPTPADLAAMRAEQESPSLTQTDMEEILLALNPVRRLRKILGLGPRSCGVASPTLIWKAETGRLPTTKGVNPRSYERLGIAFGVHPGDLRHALKVWTEVYLLVRAGSVRAFSDFMRPKVQRIDKLLGLDIEIEPEERKGKS